MKKLIIIPLALIAGTVSYTFAQSESYVEPPKENIEVIIKDQVVDTPQPNSPQAQPLETIETPSAPVDKQTTPPQEQPVDQVAVLEPIVITSYERVPEGDDTYCEIYFSDNTFERRLWEHKVKQGSSSTETVMTTYNGQCNDSILGQPKAS